MRCEPVEDPLRVIPWRDASTAHWLVVTENRDPER
jgi:hypothetical protein